jgi:GNAT superfamily N-acetyltransferase
MNVRPATAMDHDRVQAFLVRSNADKVARHGELVDALRYPSLVAEGDGELAGVLTYVLDVEACEVLTLHATVSWQGIGTALLEAVERIAQAAGCQRLWLITTNDNIDAMRFYQRRGFRMTALYADAVTQSRRRLKPGIPDFGDYRIPIRDEVEFEKLL